MHPRRWCEVKIAGLAKSSHFFFFHPVTHPHPHATHGTLTHPPAPRTQGHPQRGTMPQPLPSL